MVSTPTPASRRGGYVHEAAVYDSNDELLHVVVPHLEAAVAAGEPALVAVPDGEAALVRSAMADATGVTFLPAFAPDDSHHARHPTSVADHATYRDH